MTSIQFFLSRADDLITKVTKFTKITKTLVVFVVFVAFVMSRRP
jgi:hypothetical protein